jgi:hypothetical protein
VAATTPGNKYGNKKTDCPERWNSAYFAYFLEGRARMATPYRANVVPYLLMRFCFLSQAEEENFLSARSKLS